MNKKRTRFDARLIIADSEKDADMLYATGFFVPDPFLYFKTAKGSAVVMSDLEYGRALKQARVDHVYALSEIRKEIRASKKEKTDVPEVVDIVSWIFKREKVRSVVVPADFPIQFADPLRKRFRVDFARGPFFQERAVKKDVELGFLKTSVRASEKGFAAALKILRDASIGNDGKIYFNGKVLRTEDVRNAINAAITSMGYSISHTIVACGKHGCDPHNEGSGPLKAHQPIIVDIFPRSNKTGYFGDFTRTVVKGKADEKVRKAYRLVREGQEIAFRMIRDGVDGKEVHQAIREYFSENGFPGRENRGRKEGFIHGTGHGLGLALHEFPRINERSCVLKTGHVVTVEPGLYYAAWGGVRLEDVVVVTEKGCENLTRFPKVLEIK